ncbi:hypothetical protein ACNAN0_00610 [Agrilactobacillus fermenti]|uniref:hypothetical protein n=1 Tax=Agrilactobacillus fermenti TaxID=2586909 RepID=UPI001E445BC1|nr:hypothetical protein [Agrilactobacillus fermenti]
MCQKFHRAFGVYGIVSKKEQLLVIKKNAGPYILFSIGNILGLNVFQKATTSLNDESLKW